MAFQSDDGWGCPRCTLVSPVSCRSCLACGWCRDEQVLHLGDTSSEKERKEAVERIWSEASLQVLLALIGNAADNPDDPKFRGPVRKANARIKAGIVEITGAAEVLRHAGFEEDAESFFLQTLELGRLQSVRTLLQQQLQVVSSARVAQASGYPGAVASRKSKFDENVLREIAAERQFREALSSRQAGSSVTVPAVEEVSMASSAVSDALRLRLRLPLGGLTDLQMDAKASVAELHRRVAELTGVPGHNQRIRFGFPSKTLETLEEDTTLPAAGLHDGEVLVLEDLHDLFLGNLESGQFTMSELIEKLPQGSNTADDRTGALFIKALSAFGIGMQETNFWGVVRARMQRLESGETHREVDMEELCNGLALLQKLFHNHDPRERLALIVSCLPMSRVSWRSDRGRTELEVDRSRFLSSVSPQVLRLSRKQMLSRVEVKYVGEKGLDAGGLTRDFFSSFATRLGDDEPSLWQRTGRGSLHPTAEAIALSTRHPSGLSAEELYRACGRVFGMAVLHGCKLGCRLSMPFVRLLIHSVPDSLPELQAELNREAGQEHDFRGSKEFLEKPLAEIGLAGVLTFTRSLGSAGDVEIVPGGTRLEVTDENKDYWLTASLRHELFGAASAASAFRRGLVEVFGGSEASCPLLSLLDADALIELWGKGGIPRHEVVRWRAVTRVSPVVRQQAAWFWQVLEEDFDDELRGKVLQFATGSSSIGREGLKTFIIEPANGKDGFLPSAMTCGNMLQLPRYSSRAILERRLRTAVEATCSFEMA